jgi:hypothetical protein
MIFRNKILKLFLINNLFLLINLWFCQSATLGLILTILFLVGSVFLLSKIFKQKILLSTLYFLSIIVVPLSVIYFLSQINDLVIGLWLVLFNLLLTAFYFKKKTKIDFKLQKIKFDLKKSIVVVIYLLLAVVGFYILQKSATTEAIRSPWEVVSKYFFVVYLAMSFVLIFAWSFLDKTIKITLSFVHLLLTFSVVNIIYTLGFGYDPFIHQATEKYISENGFILPKKLYYNGQYVLVVLLHKLSLLPVVTIDRNLLPFLASFLLPLSTVGLFKKESNLGLFFLLIFPFTCLAFTTPQNLGYLLVLVTILLNFKLNEKKHLLNFVLFLVTFLIHPIAGVASFLLFLVFFLDKLKIKNIFKNIIYILSCLASLIAFGFFGLVTSFDVALKKSFDIRAFFENSFRWQADLFWQNDLEHILKSIAYFVWQPAHIFIFIFVFSLLGFYLLKKENKLKLFQKGKLFLICFLILMVNSFLLFAVVDFPFLIASEKGDFAFRFFVLATFFLLPGFIYSFNWLFQKIKNKLKIKILFIFLVSLTMTSALYFLYPRNDVYYYEKGFNVSGVDFEVINFLENYTNGDYIVLSNQQAGAGALLQFGFRYIQDKYFFYSIPTGGDLYQIYNEVVYENGGKEEIKKASELTAIKKVYIYFPAYWFNIEKMKQNLTPQADEVFVLSEGFVFEFDY